MFNEGKWHELLSKLRKLQSKDGVSEIVTKANKELNLIKIDNNRIMVATKKTNWKSFKEIPFSMIETVYNELEINRTLTQSQISKGLNVKRSAFIISALSLLPEIEYEEVKNALVFVGYNPTICKIIKVMDEELEISHKDFLDPPETNRILEKRGLLRDSNSRPGKASSSFHQQTVFLRHLSNHGFSRCIGFGLFKKLDVVGFYMITTNFTEESNTRWKQFEG